MTRRLRRSAAVLFVVAAVLFAVGVAAESSTDSDPAETHDATAESAGHDEAAEAGDHDESADPSGAVASESGHAEEATVLGINPESPAAVAAAIAALVALAVGLWFLRRRWLALLAVAFGVILAVFDVAEITHQLDDSRTGLAVLAAVIAAVHVAAAVTAGLSNRGLMPS